MFDPRLTALAESIAATLTERGDTVSVAEGSCGGVISASLLAVPGASRYFLGGSVIYTRAATRAFMSGAIATPEGMQGATETFALYLARSTAVKLESTWGIGEGGAAGPSGNPYGDPPGHAWVAVAGAAETTRHVLTGASDRPANMVAFAVAALELLRDTLDAA